MKTNLLKVSKSLAVLTLLFTASLTSYAQTVYDVIANSPNHTSLEAALNTTGLNTVLSDVNQDFTVFAPDDNAVDDLAAELGLTIPQLLASPDLEDILRYHVLNASVASSAIGNGDIETPLNNANTLKLTVTSAPAVFVNQAQVNAPDLTASNGVVHSLDAALLPVETVADVAIDSPNHSTLVSAVIEARLLPALTNPFSTLTVFAPTDAAFTEAIDSLNTTPAALLANPDLEDILLYHVLGTEEFAADLSNGQLANPLNTANTAKVTIDGPDVFINHAQVTTPDVGADNGVVHVIDQVILPATTVADVAIGTGNHTTLVSAVIEARLLPALTNPFDTLTVFAPDDAAFTESLNDLGITAVDLLADPNLADILLYHVLGAEVVSGDLTNGQLATPLNAANTIKVTVAGNGDVFANQAQVTAPDVQADNGVVHVLNQAIFANETVVDAAIDNGFTTLTVAVVTAELLPALTDPFEEYTVFAPTDAAFTQYLTDEGITAVDLLGSPDLADILLYHTLGTEVLSSALTNGPVTTLNGADVVVDLSNGVMINSASVTTPDVDVDNGVVHAIDYVLDPAVASIDELNLEAISVYPNPAANALNVKDMIGAAYSIVSMSGQTVQTGTINSTSIEINSLEEGTYFINLKDENNVYRSRFVKM